MKIKYIFYHILILIALSSYGQEATSDNSSSRAGRFQAGINFSPDICFRTLINNDGSSKSDFIISRRNVEEIPKCGFTAGLNLCYKINNNVGLETGIQYSNKGYQTRIRGLNPGQTSQYLPQKIKLYYSYYSVDIPLKVSFSNNKRKVRFFTSAGLTTNIFMKQDMTQIEKYFDRVEKNTIQTNNGFKKVNISPTISAGLDWKINHRVNLRIEPTFRYGVLKIINLPVSEYLFNGGLNIGYYVTL